MDPSQATAHEPPGPLDSAAFVLGADILAPMRPALPPRRWRGHSPFLAAVLSLLFPGLGQAYAGAWERALAWAAGPIALVALGFGIAVRTDRFTLAEIVLQGWFLTGIFVANLVLLGYRLAAIVDAWRIVDRAVRADVRSAADAHDRPLVGSGIGAARAASIGGLLTVILVMAGVHVAVAHYDLLASNLANCVFDPTGVADCANDASGPAASSTPGSSLATGPTLSLPPEGTALPSGTSQT